MSKAIFFIFFSWVIIFSDTLEMRNQTLKQYLHQQMFIHILHRSTK